MNNEVNTLILSILSYLNEKGVNVSKTKLLKLIYLFDVEFFRRHRMVFTGFDWQFYHLGPWTAELDSVLNDLSTHHLISEVPFSAKDYDGVTLRADRPTMLKDAVKDFVDEAILTRILNDWGNEPTGRLLDFVYFHTEPMERGVRHQRLDFSVIPEGQPGRYKRSASDLPSGLIAKRRREYAAKLAERKSKTANADRLTPPQYDDDFSTAMEIIERLQGS